MIRQELAAEKDIVVSLRTVERAGQCYRQELAVEARATVRFETPPGKQLQSDFGERLVEIGGSKVRAYLFVATITSERSATNGKRAGSTVFARPNPSPNSTLPPSDGPNGPTAEIGNVIATRKARPS